jgi:hypothetical protein
MTATDTRADDLTPKHIDQRRHRCLLCEKPFYRRASLQHHMEVMHRGDPGENLS